MSSGNRYRRSSNRGLPHPRKSRGDEVVSEVSSGAHRQAFSFDDEIFSCLQAIFAGCRDGVRWKVLPIGDEIGDIEAATGVPWSLVMPMMMHLRLLSAYVGSTVKTYAVQHGRFDKFFQTMEVLGVKMQLTKANRRMIGIEFFFCRGKARFQSPVKQSEAIETSNRRSRIS